MESLQTGQVVISKKGKDSGKWYIVAGFSGDGRRVFLVDGGRRTWNRPKRKNPLHVQPTRTVLKEVAEMAEGNRRINDERLRSILDEARRGSSGNRKGDGTGCRKVM
ncbi:MAG: KOW domain-containing RNA-binding protein [Thermovirgaceae bacterium]